MSDGAHEQYLKDAVRRNLQPLHDSAIFLALFTENYEEDALAVLQFGLAILLDKPIYLVVPVDKVLPENVQRLARGIERYTGPDDVGLAAQRLLARAAAELGEST